MSNKELGHLERRLGGESYISMLPPAGGATKPMYCAGRGIPPCCANTICGDRATGGTMRTVRSAY